MNGFTLHEKLAADTIPVGDLSLCRVLLMNDRRFPWLILVPVRANMRELIDLLPGDRILLMQEIASVSEMMRAVFTPDKLNVAALGNMVPQLHVHVIARKITDSAWPNPVWGQGAAESYDIASTAAILQTLKTSLGLKQN